jgi:hypothetical protein
MTHIRFTAAAGVLAALCGSPALAECRRLNVNEIKNGDTLGSIEHLCTDLPGSLDFWISGHAGHYPKAERPGDGKTYVKMIRMLCTIDGVDRVVGAVENDTLQLFCLDPDLRGQGNDTAVTALNAVLEEAGVNNRQVSWISSNNKGTQNFYKSLNVGCSCEDNGPASKGSTVRYMQFTASRRQQPIAKKARHTAPAQTGGTYRILFDTCMSEDAFNDISNEITNGGGVQPVPQNQSDGNGNVLLSTLVQRELIYTNGQDDSGNEDWLRDNPTKCK